METTGKIRDSNLLRCFYNNILKDIKMIFVKKKLRKKKGQL